MTVITWEDFIQKTSLDSVKSAVTIGAFDGVHQGHQALIDCIIQTGIRTVILSFETNPKFILRPGKYQGDILSKQQRLELFDKAGIDLVVLIDFSEKFARMSGKDFLGFLRNRGNLAFVAVGSDFRCGYRLDTTASVLKDFMEAAAVTVKIVPPVLAEDRPISSSRIRNAIATGNLSEAAKLLGRMVEIDLDGASVIPGDRVDDYDFKPTGRILPPDGRYFTVLRKNDYPSSIYYGMDIKKGIVYMPQKTAYNRVGFLARL